MLRTAALALEAGWVAVRMNCRNCGGTEALSATLYNAGQSEDVGMVLRDLAAAGLPRPFAAAGFSLGGNIVLRHAGTSPGLADTYAAVNPPIDLEACCRSLERPANAIYHLTFTLSLCRILRTIRRVRPLPGPPPSFRRIRTLPRLDTLYTAPDAGYASAEAYYAGASAGPHLDRIEAPTLVISAENDPFVPIEIFSGARLRSRNVAFVHPMRGGHLGYWQPGAQPFWAGAAILDFIESVRGRT
jgi:predicted alpha/beta-fold hydrolase